VRVGGHFGVYDVKGTVHAASLQYVAGRSVVSGCVQRDETRRSIAYAETLQQVTEAQQLVAVAAVRDGVVEEGVFPLARGFESDEKRCAGGGRQKCRDAQPLVSVYHRVIVGAAQAGEEPERTRWAEEIRRVEQDHLVHRRVCSGGKIDLGDQQVNGGTREVPAQCCKCRQQENGIAQRGEFDDQDALNRGAAVAHPGGVQAAQESPPPYSRYSEPSVQRFEKTAVSHPYVGVRNVRGYLRSTAILRVCVTPSAVKRQKYTPDATIDPAVLVPSHVMWYVPVVSWRTPANKVRTGSPESVYR